METMINSLLSDISLLSSQKDITTDMALRGKIDSQIKLKKRQLQLYGVSANMNEDASVTDNRPFAIKNLEAFLGDLKQNGYREIQRNKKYKNNQTNSMANIVKINGKFAIEFVDSGGAKSILKLRSIPPSKPI